MKRITRDYDLQIIENIKGITDVDKAMLKMAMRYYLNICVLRDDLIKLANDEKYHDLADKAKFIAKMEHFGPFKGLCEDIWKSCTPGLINGIVSEQFELELKWSFSEDDKILHIPNFLKRMISTYDTIGSSDPRAKAYRELGGKTI